MKDPSLATILAYMERRIVLTRRESQIVKMLQEEGLSNKEMAARLGITEGTVKVYMHVLCTKVVGCGGTRHQLIAHYTEAMDREHAIAQFVAWRDVMPYAMWPRGTPSEKLCES